MATKSAGKSSQSVEEKAVAAALDIAAAQGWSAVSLGAVGRQADLSLAQLRAHFDSRAELLTAWSRQIDSRVLAASGADGAPARDRLFDLLMERFECLNENRAGALAVLSGLAFDPAAAAAGLRALRHAMQWMLEGAGIEAGRIKGAARIAGLSAVYLHALHAWKTDDSRDMAATMAALDKGLGFAADWGAKAGLADTAAL